MEIPAIVLRSGRGLQIMNFGVPTGEQETESRCDDHLLCTYTVQYSISDIEHIDIFIEIGT